MRPVVGETIVHLKLINPKFFETETEFFQVSIRKLEYFSENFDIKISTKQKRAKNADKNIWLFENEHSLS